jgi:hypothetical protein
MHQWPAPRRQDLSFPVYQAQGWPATLGPLAWPGETPSGPLSSVTIEHFDEPRDRTVRPRIRVQTADHDQDAAHGEARIRLSLQVWADRDLRRRIIEAHAGQSTGEPRVSSVEMRPLQLSADAATAAFSEAQIRVEGTPVRFKKLATANGESWVASGWHGDAWLSVSAYEVEPDDLDLVVIGDPLELWRGRRH